MTFDGGPWTGCRRWPRSPTLATWELEQLRTIENVARRGHLETVDRGKLAFADGSVAVADDALCRARMNVLGTRAAMSDSADPDTREWSDRQALNPARIPPGYPRSAALGDALERLPSHARPGLARLAELM